MALPTRRPKSKLPPPVIMPDMSQQVAVSRESSFLCKIPNKQEKPGGKRYTLTEDYIGHRLLALLPKEKTLLVECIDGWYQVYVGESKRCFRIGNEIIKQIEEQGILGEFEFVS